VVQTRKVSGVKTKVIHTATGLIVRYHNTDVVVVKNGEVTLNTGGWKTVTTKRRMNQAANQFGLNYHVFQEDHEWYVFWKGIVYPFLHDSIMLNG
jgi:hypothetical protein